MRASCRPWLLALLLLLRIASVADAWAAATGGPAEPAVSRVVSQLGGSITAVAIAGARVVVGQGPRLRVVDVSDVAAPRVVAELPPFTDTITSLVFDGRYAYVAAGRAGLRIVDLSVPTAPVEVGSVAAAAPAADVAVAGHHAYVAARDAGIWVIDVAHPSAPVLTAVRATATPAVGIAVGDSAVYVAVERGGIATFDPSHPESAPKVTALAENASAFGIATAGPRAFVAAGGAGLRVLDISEPAAPRDIGGLSGISATGKVRVAGHYAYVTDRWHGLLVIDVGVPEHPTLAANYAQGESARDVALDAAVALAFVGFADGGLDVLDVSNPGAPARVGRYATPGPLVAVTAAGSTAFLGADVSLLIVDTSDATAPVVVGELRVPEPIRNIAVAGSRVYVADGKAGVRIVDASDPSAPYETGEIATSGVATDVAVVGAVAYVADGPGGLRAIDISNERAPVEIARSPSPDSDASVKAAGSRLYVAAGDGGLRILAGDRKDDLRTVGSMLFAGGASGVDVAGNFAYVAAGAAGLHVVEVSNAAALREVGAYSRLYARAVRVVGNRAYVVSERGGLAVLDISDPHAPVLVDSFATWGSAADVFATADNVMLADLEAGLVVVDLGRPDCDDHNLCTDDVVDGAGACAHKANTAACSDDDPCNGAETCAAGQCRAGAAPDCDDRNTCTDDACAARIGCVHPANAAACVTGDPCLDAGRCLDGACRVSAPVDCDDGNVCTDDSCNPSSGCVHVPNHAFCRGGGACGGIGACAAGVCRSDPDQSCDDGNPCTSDSCDPDVGCRYGYSPGACDDGDACTFGDACVAGSCTGIRRVDCVQRAAGDAAVPTWAAPGAGGPAGAAELACGDADGDGVLSAADALAVLRAATELGGCASETCDVDASGAITVGDALTVLTAVLSDTRLDGCRAAFGVATTRTDGAETTATFVPTTTLTGRRGLVRAAGR